MVGGFFFTFLLLAIAGAWSRWLSQREDSSVPWAPWVPGVAAAVWALALVFAMTGLVGGGSMEAQGAGLNRIFNAGRIADWAALLGFLAMLPVTAYAFLRPNRSTAE